VYVPYRLQDCIFSARTILGHTQYFTGFLITVFAEFCTETFLFPKLKMTIKGKRVLEVPGVVQSVRQELNAFPKEE
jgi:hypothetical protein